MATFSGKTFEVQTLDGTRWFTIDVHESRTPALKQAETLAETGKYKAVQVLADSERTGTEVIFEKIIDRDDIRAIKLVAASEAPICKSILDYYRPRSRKTIARILRNRLDQIGLSALEYLFDPMEMTVLERHEVLFPQFIQLAASAQARTNNTKTSDHVDSLYPAFEQIKKNAMGLVHDDLAIATIKTEGVDALLALAETKDSPEGKYLYACFGFAGYLKEGGGWNGKFSLLIDLLHENISPHGLRFVDEIISELLDGAVAVGELLGGQADAFAANRALIHLSEGRLDPPLNPISCIIEFNAMMASYDMPFTREALLQRVAGYVGGTRNLTREGPKAEREAFVKMLQVLTDFSGLRGGVQMSNAVTQRARIALSDNEDLSVEEAISRTIGLLRSRAARLGYLLDLCQSKIGRDYQKVVLRILSHSVSQVKSLSSLSPDGSTAADNELALSGLKAKLLSENLPEEWRNSLTKTFDKLLSSSQPMAPKRKKWTPISKEYKEMIQKTPERKSINESQVLFEEGDSGSEAYLILSGEVEIYRLNGNQEEVIATVGRGEIIGEMSLIDNQPRMASARVLKGGEVSVIDQGNFSSRLDHLDANDRVLRRLIDVLVNRVRGEGRSLT